MHRSTNIEPLRLMWPEGIPAHERVLDRLADLLFDADDVLAMLKADDARCVQWIEPHVLKVYDEVNEVMKKRCD
jgi:hypothetical protein